MEMLERLGEVGTDADRQAAEAWFAEKCKFKDEEEAALALMMESVHYRNVGEYLACRDADTMPCEILPDVPEEERESHEELHCRLRNTTPEAMRMALFLHDASNPSMFRRKENSAQYLTGLYSFMSKNLDDYKNAPPMPPTPHDYVVSARQGPSLRGCFHG